MRISSTPPRQLHLVVFGDSIGWRHEPLPPGNIRHNLPQLPSSMAYQISFMLLYFSLLFIGRTDLAVCVDGPMLLPPA